MMQTTPFLTFVGDNCGKAKEAIDFYVSVFPNSAIKHITYFKDGEPGGHPELIKYAVFSLNGTEYRISENTYKHTWSFSPGISLFIDCSSETEIDIFFEKLSSQGQIMIPLDNYESGDYGFGEKFGWCEDKYGVSWQFNLNSN